MIIEYKALTIETNKEDKSVTLKLGDGPYSSASVTIPEVQIQLVTDLLIKAKDDLRFSGHDELSDVIETAITEGVSDDNKNA